MILTFVVCILTFGGKLFLRLGVIFLKFGG